MPPAAPAASDDPTSEPCPSAPASADSTSACAWRAAALAQSVTWRGKPTASKSWLAAWRKASWIRRLAGRISNPSTAAAGVEAWMRSSADTPASLSPSSADERVPTTPGTSGPTSPASSASADPGSASSRTSPDTYPSAYATSSATWKAWVSAWKQDSSRRRRQARATSGSGSTLWPTPRAASASCRMSLRPPASIRKHMAARGRTRTGNLEDDVSLLREALSRDCPDPTTSPAGVNTSATAGLSPSFTEQLMGLPEGWTDCAP